MFGKKVKEIRKARKLTQKQLAEKIGTTKTTLSGWETSACLPSIKTLIELCKVLDVSSDYLLGLSNEQKINVDGLNESAINLLQTLANDFKQIGKYKK